MIEERDEKKRRIYYQDIVYDVCNVLDRINGRQPGMGVVCGTLNSPTKSVQNEMRALEERLREAEDNVRDLLVVVDKALYGCIWKFAFDMMQADQLVKRIKSTPEQGKAAKEIGR